MAEEEKTQVEEKAADDTQTASDPSDSDVKTTTGKQQTPTFAATEPPQDKHYWWGTGRRKSAIARVRIRPGTGKFLINKREIDNYFTETKDRNVIVSPLETVGMAGVWDIWVNVGGGGFTGQAGAVTLGLARAIAKAVPETESMLRSRGLLTRDARMSERKKPGQPGARKRFQFSKR